jgi:hypothetical protein
MRKPIVIKKANVGKLRASTGTKKGANIPAKKLAIKSTDSPAVRKRKQFALNAKKFSH